MRLYVTATCAFALCLAGKAEAAFIDKGTAWQGTHVCAGYAPMIGVSIGPNLFLCSSGGGSPPVPDDKTQASFPIRGSVRAAHVCPAGMGMVGFNNVQNRLICAATNLSGNKFVDAETTYAAPGRATLRGCPVGSVMVGIYVVGNALICQASP